MSNTPKGLGKRFGSLLPDDFDESILIDKRDRVQKLLISDIKAAHDQPRKQFNNQELENLAASIQRFGILQPIVVTPDGDRFIIVAGERRYRAAQKAGLSHVPALVRSLQELERLEIALVENVQRVDLSPLEQAMSIARLNQEFSLSLTDIAERLGKAHSTIVNSVRLLKLPDFARSALENREISEGHARAVLALSGNVSTQKELVDSIRKYSWSVRKAEQFVQTSKNKIPKTAKSVSSKLTAVQSSRLVDLQRKLGREIKLEIKQKTINISIPAGSDEDIEEILSKLSS